jgi:NTE family protein
MKKVFLFLLALTLALNSFALTHKEEDALVRDFLWHEFISLPKDKRPKIGITLSAGGLRGFSHVGTMEVLMTSGLPVDYMTGTSMGCIVGALFSAGVSQERMRALASDMPLSALSSDLTIIGAIKYLFSNRLFSSEKFQKFIDSEVGGVYYEDLSIPFACVSADIKTGEKVIFDSGPVALGVRASMNLPGIFAPVEYRQRNLVDGGVVDYMPVDIVREMGADWVLAVFALPDYSKNVPSTIMGYVLRTADLRGAYLTTNAEKNANFVIASRVGDIKATDVKETLTAVEIGAKATIKALAAMQEDLLLFSVDYVFK